MSGELATTSAGALALRPQMNPKQLIERSQVVRGVLEGVMKENLHYGTVPGTPKPSLWQPGAEQLMMTFGLYADPQVEDLSIPGVRHHYRVTSYIKVIATGEVVGVGVGECSTDEEKYAWRRAVCKEEYEAADPMRRRQKWSKGKDKPYSTDQVATNPADLANTALKMATKRSMVAGARAATAASDVFGQDLEDLDESMLAEDAREGRRTVSQPKSKSDTGKAPATVDVASVAMPTSKDHARLKAARLKAKVTPEALKAQAVQVSGSTNPAELTLAHVESLIAWLELVDPEVDGGAPESLFPGVPAEAWVEVAAAFHNDGAISADQGYELIDVAEAAGWTNVAAALQGQLGVALKDLPDGKPLLLLTRLLQEFGPKKGGA